MLGDTAGYTYAWHTWIYGGPCDFIITPESKSLLLGFSWTWKGGLGLGLKKGFMRAVLIYQIFSSSLYRPDVITPGLKVTCAIIQIDCNVFPSPMSSQRMPCSLYLLRNASQFMPATW